MADFQQTGSITTLHCLRPEAWLKLDQEMPRLVRKRPVGLVLPALYSEFENPAIYNIIKELEKVDWISRTVLVLSQADRDQYEEVCGLFSRFKGGITVLWRESEPVQEFLRTVNDAGLAAKIPGKGRACWLGMGYLLAKGDCEVIAFQDCDIKTYHRRMLTQLVYPLLSTRSRFEFSKAYYPRFTRQLNGRLTRLMLTPLIQAMTEAGTLSNFLCYLEVFRYGLAGEIAMDAGLARTMEVAPDWGLEISTLAEVHGRVPASRVCQVDLCDCYDHKHQPVSPDDPDAGLHRMAREVALAVFRGVSKHGGVLPSELLQTTLPLSYRRLAVEMTARYSADAEMNGLDYDLHGELGEVEVFARALEEAAQELAEHPSGTPSLPSWDRVEDALPDAYEQLAAAAELEHAWLEKATA